MTVMRTDRIASMDRGTTALPCPSYLAFGHQWNSTEAKPGVGPS